MNSGQATAPVFVQPISSCAVLHGEVARFHAILSGSPPPYVRWFHNRHPVRPDKNVVFHFDEATGAATLIIVDAFAEHAGQYTCTATNTAGDAATSSISSWTENIKPSFTKKLKFQSVLEGDPVELRCKLVAFPQPTILWFQNNRAIPKEQRRRICTDSRAHLHTSCLVIDSIREKDSGSYKVMALNSEGSAESTASLLGEFPGKTSSKEPPQHRIRHSFEPQSRTRAIQIMRGELVDTLVPPTGTTSSMTPSDTGGQAKAESFVQPQRDVHFQQMT
uniref:Ig-like domain-containing protein n=1 Tax=Salarias fasciatus TaxID=181472 RepID=A0A672I9A7_SALFA